MELEMEHMKFPFKNSSGRYENKYCLLFFPSKIEPGRWENNPSKIEAEDRKMKLFVNSDGCDSGAYDSDGWDSGGDNAGW